MCGDGHVRDSRDSSGLLMTDTELLNWLDRQKPFNGLCLEKLQRDDGKPGHTWRVSIARLEWTFWGSLREILTAAREKLDDG